MDNAQNYTLESVQNSRLDNAQKDTIPTGVGSSHIFVLAQTTGMHSREAGAIRVPYWGNQMRFLCSVFLSFAPIGWTNLENQTLLAGGP